MNRNFLGTVLFTILIVFSQLGTLTTDSIGISYSADVMTPTTYQGLVKTDLWTVKEPLAINFVRLSPKGDLLAVSYTVDPKIDIFEAFSGKLQYTIEKKPLFAQDVGLSVLLWSPNGDYLASVIPYEPVDIWDMTKSSPNNAIKIAADGVTSSLTWAPDSGQIAGITRGRLGNAKNIIWDITSNTVVTTFDGTYSQLFWSPDGAQLATSNGSTIRFWDTNKFELLKTLNTHPKDTLDPIGLYAWSPDSKRIAGVSCNNIIGNCSVWTRNLEDDSFLQQFESDDTISSVKSILWSKDGKLLISDNGRNAVRIWDSETQKLLLRVEIAENSITAIDWNSTTSMLIVGSSDGQIYASRIK